MCFGIYPGILILVFCRMDNSNSLSFIAIADIPTYFIYTYKKLHYLVYCIDINRLFLIRITDNKFFLNKFIFNAKAQKKTIID